jgi:hypothetical protein
LIETVIALLFAHCIADFVLQSAAMVEHKRRMGMLLAHGGIVAATAWLALGAGSAPQFGAIAVIAGSHVTIDWLKIRFGGAGFRPFAADQAAHLAMILIVASIWPAAFAAGHWADAARILPVLDAVLPAMVVAAGAIAAVRAGTFAVGALMTGLQLPPDPADDPSLPQGGRLIGQLERLIILILVLAGEVVGIGLLIAAKSILRFGEVQRGRQAAEYVIIGTLASFAWALAVAIAAAWALGGIGSDGWGLPDRPVPTNSLGHTP